MKCSHNTLLSIAGTIWLAIGTMLMYMGIHFLLDDVVEATSIIPYLVICLLLGYCKGRLVLRKAARRTFERLSKLPNPAPLSQLYTKGNYAIIALMMLMGMGMRFFEVAPFIRGLIDTTVGAALIQGGTGFFSFIAPTQAQER